MTDVKNNYLNAFWSRRKELTSIVFDRTKGVVNKGPFKGMKILPKFSWGDGDSAGKLLGLYESELFDCIEDSISRNPDLVLNIGCAEGYYGIGLCKRTKAKTILFDIDEKALNIANENAMENNVSVSLSTDCSIKVYELLLKDSKNPLIFIDAEGIEEEILDLEKISELSKSSIIVESHDCNRAGITEKLIKRFNDTHDIKLIKQGKKNPYMQIIDDLDDYDKMILCVEARPSTMYWLYMTPKR